MTCTMNRFAVPGVPSLGELLVKSPTGGAAAVWGPSGLAFHGEARQLAEALLRPGRGGRAGSATGCWARCASFVERGGDPQLLDIYNLLGDPALLIRRGPAPPAGGGTSGEIAPDPQTASGAPTSRRASSTASRWRPWPRSARPGRRPRATWRSARRGRSRHERGRPLRSPPRPGPRRTGGGDRARELHGPAARGRRAGADRRGPVLLAGRPGRLPGRRRAAPAPPRARLPPLERRHRARHPRRPLPLPRLPGPPGPRCWDGQRRRCDSRTGSAPGFAALRLALR